VAWQRDPPIHVYRTCGLLQEMERRRVESGGELDKAELNVFEVELMRLQNKMAGIASEVEEVHTAAKDAEEKLAQRQAGGPEPPQRPTRGGRDGASASSGAAVGSHQGGGRGDAGVGRTPAVAAPPRTTRAAQPDAVVKQLRGLQIQGLQDDGDDDDDDDDQSREVRQGPAMC
jgi:hypothetical protein